MRLSSRFILDILFLLAPAFVVVASMAWSAGVTAHEVTTEKVVHQLVVHDGTPVTGAAERRNAA